MRTASEPIAIVGIGCRYADARGPAEFYEIVRSRRNTVRDAPQHRIELGYDIDHFFDPRPRIPGKISSKKGGFLEHPELFDPEAFGISPRDALTMEPQQRLMIEVAWDALDDAGIPVESVAGERVAVILGYMAEDYSRERAGVLGEAAVYRGHDVFTVGGMSHAVLSGRLSFLLGVTGPSLTLDTACSSSLYAAHLACESLRRGESTMAIAGGANLFLSPEGNIALSRSGMLSMSGACRAFDAKADGFVRAEGAGVVVLRPLSDALAAGNPIYAVIRGSGVSADGRDGGHMMAPGRKGQAQAMRDAYAMAGVSPADVHYVETHGTGTMIGDPVEIGALADVMGPGRSPDRPLRVASIKGNLGHTESASGIAGLINACLAIRNRTLPPQLHFETPSPAIPWDQVPIQVQREMEPWPYPEKPLVGVNSFGISGTNAHFVLEAPPEPDAAATAHLEPRPDSRSSLESPVLIPITAHDSNALHETAEKLRDRLVAEPDLDLRDLAYTLSRRRSLRAHRLALVASSVEEARQVLDTYLAGEASPELRSGVAGAAGAAPVVMVFPGQGSQWLGMGRALLRRAPAFAESIDSIDAAYRKHVAWSLRAVLEGRPERQGGLDVDWTVRLDVLQPVLVAIEVALATLWRHFGIEPRRVLGQSMGEIAAAHVSGALSLADMAQLACERGRVVARAAGSGAMAIVSLGGEAVARRLDDWPAGVEIAGSNSPTTTILSGDARAVAAAVETLEAEGVFARLLEVDFASHCFHMDPLVEPFRMAIGTIEARPSTIPFDSTVDGETRQGDELGSDYWLRNLRQAVAFDRGLAVSLAAGGEIFLEVSPHPTLPRAIDETAQALGYSPRYVSSLRRGEDEERCLLLSLAELFVRGHPIDWSSLCPSGRVVTLPLYAYQRKRYFFSERSRVDTFRPVHPLLAARTDSSLDPRLHSWDFPLDADSGSFLVDGPAPAGPSGSAPRRAPDALAIELALAVGEALWPGRGVRIADLVPARPLELEAAGRRTVQIVVREEDADSAELRIASRERDGDPWLLHVTARLVVRRPAAGAAGESAYAALGGEARVASEHGAARLVRDGNAPRSIDDYYAALARCGIGAGTKGRILRELESEMSPSDAQGGLEETGGIVAKLMLPRSLEAEWYAYHAHPLLIETALQLTGSLFDSPTAVRVHDIESIELGSGLGSDCLCRVRRRAAPPDPSAANRADGTDRRRLVADLELFDRKGLRVGEIRGARVEALPARVGPSDAIVRDWHRVEWVAASPTLLESAREIERFILVSDSESIAAWLAAELDKQGVQVRFCEKVEDLEALVRLHRATGDGRYGFLLLAWADRGAESAPEPDFQREFRVGQWAAAIREHTSDAAQIWIATRAVQARTTKGPAEASAPDDDAVRGADDLLRLGPHIAREIDTFASCAEMQQCRLFDAKRDLTEIDLDWLAALLGRPGEERQFVMAQTGPLVPRLVAVDEGEWAVGAIGSDGSQAAGARNFRALATGGEGRGALALRACAEQALAPGEIRIEVQAAALSSFDVLTALGLAREAAAAEGSSRAVRDDLAREAESALGLDLAGVVVAVGSGVRDLAVGDRVVGLQPGGLLRRVVLPRHAVARIPARIDFAHAASLAWPSLVATHVLGDVARVRADERVLVVSAGGGVGQALVGRARALGAQVFATASTAERRAALAAQGATLLGSDGSGGSSSVLSAFSEKAEAPDSSAPDAARFDVIIGSECGPALHARLRSLAEGGRYVDLCPRERFLRDEIGALRLGRNRAYQAVDCLAWLETDPQGIAARLEEVLADFDAGVLAAIPVSTFPVAQAARALRFMTQNRHHGRVVLDFDAAEAVPLVAPTADEARLFEGRRVLVSSAGESPRAGAARAAIARGLRSSGADEVVEVELELGGSGALAVLADGTTSAEAVERSRADAWIHVADESTQAADPLRHRLARSGCRDRILISLREDVVGEPARDRAWEARLWLDRLILAGGKSGSEHGIERSWRSLSVGGDATPERIARAVLRNGRGHAASDQLVLLGAAEQLLRAERAPSPLMIGLDDARSAAASRAFDRGAFLALSPPERRAALLRHIGEELAGVLGLAADRRDRLDPSIRLDALGLDSLMTMELFMGLGRSLELPLAADWFGPGPTLAEIAQVLVRRLEASLAGASA